jgi:hypothetical protein
MPSRTARGTKVDVARQAFASYGDRFEIVNVNDIATDDISAHLEGVVSLIHTAAPLSSRGDAKHILTVSFYSSSFLPCGTELFPLIGSY